MNDFELRPPPGATDALVPKKHRARPLRAHLPRASLRRYACPCGCGRHRWFSQTRVLRGPGPA
jgi:hypothetical protein